MNKDKDFDPNEQESSIDRIKKYTDNNDINWDLYKNYDQQSNEDEKSKPANDLYEEVSQDTAELPLFEDVSSKQIKNPFKRFWVNRFMPFWRTKKGKIITISLSVLLVIILAVGSYGYYILSLLNNDDNNPNPNPTPISDDYDKLTGEDVYEASASEVKTLDEMIYKFYNAKGDALSQKTIVNILLIGRDTNSNKEYGHSDSMILVSINKKTKQTKMISFFRDSYCYMPYKDGLYGKMTWAHFYGGPEMTVTVIEHLYKVKIDGYVSINFANFPKLVDALGGVTVEVTEKESKFMARTTKNVRVPAGKVTLNGREALVYSRIRHLDSDTQRTERQRKVIQAIISKASSASVGQLNSALKQYLPYVNTDISSTRLITLGSQALLGKWYSFPITTQSAPSDLNTYTSATIRTNWVWVVDYPAASQIVQKYIYGKTNVHLNENRPDFKALIPGRGYSGNGSSSTTKKAVYTTSSYSTTQKQSTKKTVTTKSTTGQGSSTTGTTLPSTTLPTTAPSTTAPENTTAA